MVVISSTGVFYFDDGLIELRDTEWTQGGINVLIGIFRRGGLMDNIAKSKTMTCHPGEIISEILE